MGMGEPLHNMNGWEEAMVRLCDEQYLGISPRRITLSTSGEVMHIRDLANFTKRPRLAISLNASNDEQRDELMPVNKRYPLADLIMAIDDFPLRKMEQITLEYVMLRGVNDTPEDAINLNKLLRPVKYKVKINLIPFNEADGLPYKRPASVAVDAFKSRLEKMGFAVTVRISKGSDIDAACGQLVSRESD